MTQQVWGNACAFISPREKIFQLMELTLEQAAAQMPPFNEAIEKLTDKVKKMFKDNNALGLFFSGIMGSHV